MPPLLWVQYYQNKQHHRVNLTLKMSLVHSSLFWVLAVNSPTKKCINKTKQCHRAETFLITTNKQDSFTLWRHHQQKKPPSSLTGLKKVQTAVVIKCVCSNFLWNNKVQRFPQIHVLICNLRPTLLSLNNSNLPDVCTPVMLHHFLCSLWCLLSMGWGVCFFAHFYEYFPPAPTLSHERRQKKK